MYMSILLTNAICRKKKISKGKVTLGCDCKGAIQAVQGGRIISSRWNSYDLLYHIQKAICDSPVEWEFRWVRGHQDRKKQKKKLNIWALTNIEADKDAKRYWKQIIDMEFQLLNTQRRTVRCGECVLMEKLLQRKSLHDYTTIIGFKRPRHSGSDNLTSQVNKSMRLTGAYLKGLKWHLHKQNGSGELSICKTSAPLPVICIDENTVITIYAHNANRMKISFRDAVEMLICAARDDTVPDFAQRKNKKGKGVPCNHYCVPRLFFHNCEFTASY